MRTTMQDAIDSAPAGTRGYVCEPWTPGETYGVAANWAEASAPVYVYGPDGWGTDSHGRQVADFCHQPVAAMESELAEALVASGDDEDEAADLATDAIEF